MKHRLMVLQDTWRENVTGVVAIILTLTGSGLVFYLYGLPLEPFAYVFLLLVFGETMLFLSSYLKNLKKAKEREQMINAALAENALPHPDTLMEKDYQEMIRILKKELFRLQNTYELERQEEIDYYTAWVHQIKTPIAVLRMQMGDCEPEFTRNMETELFRIEQYVDMVLQYIRLDSSNDLVIQSYPLDELIRETIRKYAPQFIYKRLRLTYEGTDRTVITDRKWFTCILEQLLSNAIKYTPIGSITISIEQDVLKISDTGIGISKEDIPRIFEKGFTGGNGHLEKHSSGLGLYLCRKAANLLDIVISVESAVGNGSEFSLNLQGKICVDRGFMDRGPGFMSTGKIVKTPAMGLKPKKNIIKIL